MRSASLPMYNFAGLRDAHGAMWEALRGRLAAKGVTGLPVGLDYTARPVPAAIAREVLLTQTCGYPLLKAFAGQYRLLAVPDYDAPGCHAYGHRAFIVVRSNDPCESAEDLRGARFGYNSLLSNSGMNLPRALFAPLARDGRFFEAVVESGSHPASLALLRGGDVDAISVDCLTWAFACDHDPAAVAGLRVLCETGPSPAIPYITSAATTAVEAAALIEALLWFGAAPQFEQLRRSLRLKGIGPAGSDAYRALTVIEDSAAALGYPDLA